MNTLRFGFCAKCGLTIFMLDREAALEGYAYYVCLLCHEIRILKKVSQ